MRTRSLLASIFLLIQLTPEVTFSQTAQCSIQYAHQVWDCSEEQVQNVPQVQGNCPQIRPCEGEGLGSLPTRRSSFAHALYSGAITAGVTIDQFYGFGEEASLRFRLDDDAVPKRAFLYFTTRSTLGNLEENLLLRPDEDIFELRNQQQSSFETCRQSGRAGASRHCEVLHIAGPAFHGRPESWQKEVDRVFRVELDESYFNIRPGDNTLTIRSPGQKRYSDLYHMGVLLVVFYDKPSVAKRRIILHEGYDSANVDGSWPDKEYSTVNPINLVFRNGYSPTADDGTIEVHLLINEAINNAVTLKNQLLYNSIETKLLQWDAQAGSSATIPSTTPASQQVVLTGAEIINSASGDLRTGLSLGNNPIGVGDVDHDAPGFRNSVRGFSREPGQLGAKMAELLGLRLNLLTGTQSSRSGAGTFGVSIQPRIYHDGNPRHCACLTTISAFTLLSEPSQTTNPPLPPSTPGRQKVILRD